MVVGCMHRLCLAGLSALRPSQPMLIVDELGGRLAGIGQS